MTTRAPRRRGARLIVAAGALLSTATPAYAAPAPAMPQTALANRCVAFASAANGGFATVASRDGYRADATRAAAARFFLKPTGLGTYLVYDADGELLTAGDGAPVTRGTEPGPAAEWAIGRRAGGTFALRSTKRGEVLAVDAGSAALVLASDAVAGRRGRFRALHARGCRAYPDAEVGAAGRPFRGPGRRGPLFGLADPHVHVTADLRAGGRVVSGESFNRFGITEALGHDADVHGQNGTQDITGNLLRSGSPAGTHDTTGWPAFKGWPTSDTLTHQQVYYRWLERVWMAGLRLIVAQTVEDEPLCRIEPVRSHSCDETETLAMQVARLKALQDYVDAQSGGRGRGWFRLVFTPQQATRAIERGKLAVIIGAESSNPFGCSQFRGEPRCDRAAIDRGIAKLRGLGIRSLFVAHWVDNALSGAALEGGDKGLFIGAMQQSFTGQPFSTGPCPYPGQGEEIQPAGPAALDPVVGAAIGASPEPLPVHPSGRQCNTKGLTELGAYAVRRLMDAHMLIEVDHMSERARDALLAIADERRYPLISSHTGTGGTWAPAELRRLYATGGFASATVDDASKLPAKVLAFGRYAKRPGVGLSTDTGGFAELPGPVATPGHTALAYPFRSFDRRVSFVRERTGERTFDLNEDGVAHYGLLADLLADVERQKQGRAALDVLFRSADAYVRTWRLAAAR